MLTIKCKAKIVDVSQYQVNETLASILPSIANQPKFKIVVDLWVADAVDSGNSAVISEISQKDLKTLELFGVKKTSIESFLTGFVPYIDRIQNSGCTPDADIRISIDHSSITLVSSTIVSREAFATYKFDNRQVNYRE